MIARIELDKARMRFMGMVTVKDEVTLNLSATSNRLILSAQDNDLSIFYEIPEIHEEEWFIGVSLLSFIKTIKELPKKENHLEIASNGKVLRIKGESFIVRFPIIPFVSRVNKFTGEAAKVKTTDLNTMINFANFCVDMKCTQAFGRVIHAHQETGELKIVGTDSKRLAYSSMPMEIDLLKKPICIPEGSVREITKFLEAFDEVEVAQSENNIVLINGSCQITVPLSSIIFPNYQGILPRSFLYGFSVSRSEFVANAKTVMAGAVGDDTLTISFQESKLVLTAHTGQFIEKIATIDSALYIGPPTTLRFKAKHILEAFAQMNFKEILFRFTSEKQVFSMEPLKKEGEIEFKYVLLPLSKPED